MKSNERFCQWYSALENPAPMRSGGLRLMSGAIILAAFLGSTTATAGPIIQGAVSANLVRPSTGEPGAVFYSQSNNLPPAPSARGFGGVDNSLGESDSNSYGSVPSGSQSYGAGVTWAEGSAESDIGTGFSFLASDGSTATVWGGATFDASLDLDLTGASGNSSAEGLANGGVSGYTYDGSDTAGVDGKYTFNVEFTIDALVVGPHVDGAFGIQVDVFNFTTGDLVSDLFSPRVRGTGIDGFLDMTEETRIDQLGDAWTFSLTAADILADGGSVNGSYTAEFSFLAPNDPPSANAIFLTLDAFALGEATVPEPSSMALAVLGLLGLGTIRRHRRV